MPTVSVTGKGAILLGPHVACDGFYRPCRVRVQTHVHADHMADFNSSKGTQTILASHATRDLLIAERNADLRIRSNFIGLAEGEPHQVSDGPRVRLFSSEHMLGAVQVEVEYADGHRVGYSGDFAWPIRQVIQVEELVLDCTYGAPGQIRRYTQAEAEERLLELTYRLIKRGPVYIKSHRGSLERALSVLAGNIDVPILANDLMLREIDVYRRYGHSFEVVTNYTEQKGREIERSMRFVRLLGPGDAQRVDMAPGGSQIVLSAFMSGPDSPVTEYSERSYCVAMSNHADFNGTIEYARATGAKRIVVDNSRHGNAVVLAQELSRRLGITATASDPDAELRWGF